jgi:hypothetical protein
MIDLVKMPTTVFILLIIFLFSFTEIPYLPIPFSVATLLTFVLLLKHFQISLNFLRIIILFLFVEVTKTIYFASIYNLPKSIMTILLLSFSICAIFNLVEKNIINPKFERVVGYILRIAISIIFIDVFIDYFIFNSSRPSGILFLEPSHLGFIINTLVIYFILQKNYFFLLLSSLTILLAFSSATIAVMILSIFAIFVPHLYRLLLSLKVQKYVFFMFFVFLSTIFFISTNPDLIARVAGVVSFGGDTDGINMSSLVYLNGWMQAFGYLHETYGLGIGINNMGYEGGLETTLSPIIIESFDGIYLNYNDGSFLVSKMLSELGLITTSVLIYYLAVKSIKIIKLNFNNRFNKDMNLVHLSISMMIPNFIYLFFRGAGYFESQVFFLLIAIAIIRYVSK